MALSDIEKINDVAEQFLEKNKRPDAAGTENATEPAPEFAAKKPSNAVPTPYGGITYQKGRIKGRTYELFTRPEPEALTLEQITDVLLREFPDTPRERHALTVRRRRLSFSRQFPGMVIGCDEKGRYSTNIVGRVSAVSAEQVAKRTARAAEKAKKAEATGAPSLGGDDDGVAIPQSSLGAAITAQGLAFPTELVTSYVLSLQTKPFAILSGISGTGKTKLAQAVAEWAGTGEEEVQVAGAPASNDAWRMRVFPYMLKFVRVVVPVRVAARAFGVPEQRSTPVALTWDNKSSKGRLEYIENRNLYYVHLNAAFVTALKAASVSAGDFLDVTITPAEGNEATFNVAFARVDSTHHVQRRETKRWDLISVRPDWVDGKGLLGFFNPITVKYVGPPFVRRRVKAFADECDALAGEPVKPHFVILDEMNLARVEYYFADLLSVMESRRQKAAAILQDTLHLHDEARCLPLSEVEDGDLPDACTGCRASREAQRTCRLHPDGVPMLPPQMELPRNLFVTGTVNIDETTHAFSPKVLDRANVLEFHEVRLEGLLELAPDAGVETPWDSPDDVFELVTPVGAADFQQLDAGVRRRLLELQGLLGRHNLHFGYRVANEVSRFVNLASEALSEEDAFDLQVVQKVLPKLHGTKAQLRGVLWELLCFFLANKPQPLTPAALQEFERRLDDDDDAKTPMSATSTTATPPSRLPRSARKTLRMLKRLETQGFVSFLE